MQGNGKDRVVGITNNFDPSMTQESMGFNEADASKFIQVENNTMYA